MSRPDNRVLLVEDDPALLRLLGTYLMRMGLIVVACPTMQSVLDVAGLENYRAAIIDITLPDGNGLDLAQLLHDRGPEIHLIICSGHALDRSATGLPESAPVTVLQKPFTPAALSGTLARLLELPG